MANKTSQEETAAREQAASKDDTEKESKANEEQSPSGNKPLAAKSGYYYAHNQVSAADRPLVGAQTIYNHSPLPQEEVKKLQRQNSENGESLWNKGGTWEEKDFSKWAEGRIKELVPAIAAPAGTFTFTEVKSVDDCHATIVHSRGKKKASVEVEKLKISWKAAAGEGKGTLEVRDLSSLNPGDVQLAIKADKKSDQQAKIDADLKATKAAITGMVAALQEELMAK